MKCKNCENTSFEFYFLNGDLISKCKECESDFNEDELPFEYWEDEKEDVKIDRRKRKRSQK